MDLEIGYKHYLFLRSDSSSKTQQFVWLQDCVLVHHLCIHTRVSAARWSPPTVVTRALKAPDDIRVTVRSTIRFCVHSSVPVYLYPDGVTSVPWKKGRCLCLGCDMSRHVRTVTSSRIKYGCWISSMGCSDKQATQIH